jgi:D-alanyl-D-alanine carboxypeptidase (penicillin-binding protein 5/6)
MVASAAQDGRRLIVVVNGLTSEAERAAETKRLLDLGFREFREYALLKAGDVVGEAEVWAGEQKAVPLAVREPVKLIMRRAARDGLKAVLTYSEPVDAPVTRGQQLGKLTITAPGVQETVVPVYAGAEVEEGGIFTQIKLGIKDLLSSKPEAVQANEELNLPPTSQSVEAPTQ